MKFLFDDEAFWEAVITPVVDYALTRGEIAAGQIVLFSYSLGGYLVARAAAFEHRVAALILDDGIYDFGTAVVVPGRRCAVAGPGFGAGASVRGPPAGRRIGRDAVRHP